LFDPRPSGARSSLTPTRGVFFSSVDERDLLTLFSAIRVVSSGGRFEPAFALVLFDCPRVLRGVLMTLFFLIPRCFVSMSARAFRPSLSFLAPLSPFLYRPVGTRF